MGQPAAPAAYSCGLSCPADRRQRRTPAVARARRPAAPRTAPGLPAPAMRPRGPCPCERPSVPPVAHLYRPCDPPCMAPSRKPIEGPIDRLVAGGARLPGIRRERVRSRVMPRSPITSICGGRPSSSILLRRTGMAGAARPVAAADAGLPIAPSLLPLDERRGPAPPAAAMKGTHAATKARCTSAKACIEACPGLAASASAPLPSPRIPHGPHVRRNAHRTPAAYGGKTLGGPAPAHLPRASGRHKRPQAAPSPIAATAYSRPRGRDRHGRCL